MDEQQAREEIQLIREMVEKTRRATAESGTIFIFWGILIILGIIGTYLLAYFHLFGWIWLNWVAVTALGWAYSIYYGIKREQKQKIMTYAQSSAKNLSIACAIGYLFVCFVLPALGIYHYNAIPVMVALISGILLYALGGIYEWNLLKWCGLLWWLSSVGMIFIPEDYRALFFVPLIIIGYLVPGFIFRSKYKKELSLR